MPVSSPICTHPGQPSASAGQHYRNNTSHKIFSPLLNRTLTIQGRHRGQTAQPCVQFSVLELLKHLNIEKALLKGSTARNPQSINPPSDIDLQIFHDKGELDKLPKKILTFLTDKSQFKSKEGQAITERTWFRNVTHRVTDKWKSLLVHVGYSSGNATTLDLYFTNKRTAAHDAIHASRVIQFNLQQATPQVTVIDSWHPSLVQWLSTHQMFWFNPGIEEGLGRLSYRLSKFPDARLLQPDLPVHFCEKASIDTLKNICLRVMTNEYTGSRLEQHERLKLWEPVIEAAQTDQHSDLRDSLLRWSKSDTIEQLNSALNDPAKQFIVLGKLTNGCQVGADFKTKIKEFLNTDKEAIRARLKPMIGQALGATLVCGDTLFSKLDVWQDIQKVPEGELQTVFTEFLEHLTRSSDQTTSNRARNMLGWLRDEMLASLKFWIDRIPEDQRCTTPQHKLAPVLQAALNILNNQGLTGLQEALPQMESIGFGLEDCHALMRNLMDSNAKSVDMGSDTGSCPTLDLMNLVACNSAVLAAFQSGFAVKFNQDNILGPIKQFHQQFLAFTDSIQSRQKVPPLLRSIVKSTKHEIQVELPKVLLTFSCTQKSITVSLGRMKHFISENSYALLSPLPNGSGNGLQVIWPDRSAFKGQQKAFGNFEFYGELSQFSDPCTPKPLRGLLQAGRILALKRIPDIGFMHHGWSVKGKFNGRKLLGSDSLGSALLAMKEGTIFDEFLGAGMWIKHDVKNYKLDECVINAKGCSTALEIKVNYKPTATETADASEYSNVWNAVPEFHNSKSIYITKTPAFGQFRITTVLPWNSEDQSFSGSGTLKATEGLSFEWTGRVKNGNFLPMGSLYLDSQKNAPAIVFNSEDEKTCVPVELFPVIADLVGERANGSYSYSPKVWPNPNQWPEHDFEGFVSLQQFNGYLFSGYITPTGHAVGVLSESVNSDKHNYTAWTGSFIVQPASAAKRPAMGLAHPTKLMFVIPLNKDKVIMPHGLLHQHTQGQSDLKPREYKGRIYFLGEGISYDPVEQDQKALRYICPNTTFTLTGIDDYTLENNPRHLNIVFNPGSNRVDFVKIRPKNFEKLSNFQEIYNDSRGMHAKWMVANQTYQIGEIHFPSGMTYSGRISLDGEYFNLHGKGKLSWKALTFSCEFKSDFTVKVLEGKSPDAEHWVKTYCGAENNQTFKLDEWIEIISGGNLNWDSDVKAHLKFREL